jgi:hypothetical protein
MKKDSIRAKSPRAEKKAQKVTIGMDLGDKTSRYCMLDDDGRGLRESGVGTNRKAMTQVFARLGRCRPPDVWVPMVPFLTMFMRAQCIRVCDTTGIGE